MVMTLHRSESGTFFPCREDGGPSFVGAGAGTGYHINVAWNTDAESEGTGSGPGAHEYRYACEQLLFPIAKEFKPDLILISCGFDSAIHDPLGESQLCPLAYYWMTRELLNICEKMVVIQEGGYNTDFLGQHASGVVKALLKIIPESPTQADIDAGITSIEDIR